MLQFSRLPDEALEKAILETLISTLMSTNAAPPLAPNAEADLLKARAMELATLRSPFNLAHLSSRVATGAGFKTLSAFETHQAMLEWQKKRDADRDAALAAYERT